MTPDHNVNVTIRREPRPPRKHPVLDCLGLVFAAALFSVPFGSSVLFAILAGLFVAVYLLTRNHKP